MNSIKYILLLNVLVLLSCNNDKKDVLPNVQESHRDLFHVSKAQFDNAKMEIGTLTEQSFAQKVHATGEIDVPPPKRAVIRAFSGGYIQNTTLLVGD